MSLLDYIKESGLTVQIIKRTQSIAHVQMLYTVPNRDYGALIHDCTPKMCAELDLKQTKLGFAVVKYTFGDSIKNIIQDKINNRGLDIRVESLF